MFVLTIDQRGSRSDRDRIPALLARVSSLATARFERTAGDEAQGVARDATTALAIVAWALREAHWHVGVGIGGGTAPPGSVRAGAGPAFLAARAAVEAAKREPISVAVRAQPGDAADADGLLRLLGYVRARRTPAQWRVADARDRADSGRAAARALGITPQAVSQSLRASGWREERAGWRLAEHLLASLEARAARARMPA